MVVQRRPAEVQAEVPTSVYALDLTRLSELLAIPEDELVSGFQSNPTASDMHGVIVDAGEDVPFETVGHVVGAEQEAHDDWDIGHINIKVRGEDEVARLVAATSPAHQERKVVRQVLLTAAVRKTSLDAHGLPKCLIQLGSQTIIGHILTQLYAAGIERVVISVAAAGARIMAAVKQTPFFTKMKIEFLNLGSEYRDGHARSILAARTMFPKGPFLIHTADHIFDKSIISKISNFQLNDAVACVLVETDIAGLTADLPPTAVRVQLGKETVTKIARDLLQFDGFDAGLFVSSVAIFDAMQDLAAKKEYFSLAEALNYFTKFNKLTYLPTAGETWFSIETKEQLAYTKDSDGVSVLSPWTVFLASTPLTLDDPSLTKNVVIGVSAPDQDASLRVAGNTEASTVFEGFIIGVSNADLRGEVDMSGSDYEAMMESDTRPLLSLGRRATFLSSSRSRLSRQGSFIDRAGLDESFVLSFPMDDESSKTIEDASAGRQAYLIEMSPDPSTPVGPSTQYMLAVPGKEHATPRPDRRERRTEILPSDITDISLETRGYDDNLEVTVVVRRQVPLIGYILLFIALFTVSSVGVALDMVDNVAPLLKLFWRNTASSLTTFPLAMLAIRRNGAPTLNKEFVLTMLFMGTSYAFYLGSYVVSLSLTSVGHATLFNNAHSLLLVFVKLLMGQPVALFEGLGAAVGIAGGAVTTMDSTATSESDRVVAPSALGDIVALVGALGGATYFVLAKKLRPKMDLLVFMWALTTVSAITLLLTMLAMGQDVTFSTDVHNGLFGWINPLPDRLLTVCYLVLVCDLMGTMGYISVMKYFDPIVISVVCLLEPIVATAMGIVVGVDAIPGYLTFIGATLVLGGTFMVIATQSEKTEQIDATEAIKSTGASATPKPVYSTRVKRKTMNYGSVN
uniref:EamA domain-containing protein n=1 Tax=Globisporangium ultimum (strain ATCC 200006 / CBS 805.95 / DAOM BR144) TaxID=431595 RepID=K3WKV7_GLOUD